MSSLREKVAIWFAKSDKSFKVVKPKKIKLPSQNYTITTEGLSKDKNTKILL